MWTMYTKDALFCAVSADTSHAPTAPGVLTRNKPTKVKNARLRFIMKRKNTKIRSDHRGVKFAMLISKKYIWKSITSMRFTEKGRFIAASVRKSFNRTNICKCTTKSTKEKPHSRPSLKAHPNLVKEMNNANTAKSDSGVWAACVTTSWVSTMASFSSAISAVWA